jgi:shikimate dehydrogenase
MDLTINGKTRLAGVIGDPITHTLSPAMHNAAFKALGINAVYLPLPCPKAGLKRLLHSLADLGAVGVNVTIPHKQLALECMDSCSPEAERIGAVNTVVFQGAKLVGHNTDGLGFLESLKQAKIKVRGQRAVLLGAGGAGRAVAVSLLQAGVAHLTVSEPFIQGRRKLQAYLKKLGYTQVLGVEPNTAVLCQQSQIAHLVVNASPLGLKPTDPLPLPADWLSPQQSVMDLVYGHGPTAFIQAAQRRKARTVPGWHMLLYQGAESFRLWTGCKPPVEVMRQALLRADVERKV